MGFIHFRYVNGGRLDNTIVKITNCGEFNVYYLPALPPMCFMAWCFGDESPCAEGLASDDGYPPCVNPGTAWFRNN